MYQALHAPSSSGDYASSSHKSTNYVCTRARYPMKSIIIPQDTYLTGLAPGISRFWTPVKISQKKIRVNPLLVL